MRTERLGRHIARNTVHYGAQFGWFFALTLIPIAQVVAIEFTMPIWTALLAVAFLGERLGAARIVAVALGLVGVVVIVRPGVEHVDPGQLIALAAAVGFAISIILVKSLTATDSVVTIIFWMLVVQSVIGIVPAALVWRTPTAAGLAVDRRDRALRHLLALLHDAGAAARRRDDDRADGLPARAAHRRRRLAGLQRAHRSLHRHRRRA